MKKLYALCLITLAAVVADVFLFHSPARVQAQNAPGKLTVHSVMVGLASLSKSETTFDTFDTKVMGFQCIPRNLPGSENGDGFCFIVTGN